jgi:hypothetical protein
MKSPDGEHTDCARAVDPKSSGAATNRIVVRRSEVAELFTRRSGSAPEARRVRPIKGSDVSLALDTSAK